MEGTMSGNPKLIRDRAAFSLVELLTVVFIISLLIGILVPSLSAARTAAKKATTRKTLQSTGTGLEMFRNDTGAEFAQTNGYPPSFAHPPINEAGFDAHDGQFPFLDGYPTVSGAHWLPAMLIGLDSQGYIKRSAVPTAIKTQPDKWYDPDADSGKPITERAPRYIDAGNTPMLITEKLTGRENAALLPSWGPRGGPEWKLPVIVDGFDYPILYYVANKHGRPTNMVSDEHNAKNDYSGGAQEEGVPYYFHEDNEMFTGNKDEAGWDFNGPHAIAESGADLTADQLVEDDNRDTFARYIIDRKLWRDIQHQQSPNAEAPLRPANADTFLLISPGPDGRYGTTDDVSNLPAFEEQ
jgi:type II secretory pathway pseudopilin PulG